MYFFAIILACQSQSSIPDVPAVVAQQEKKIAPQDTRGAPDGGITKEQRRSEPPIGVLSDTQLAKMLLNRDSWQQPKRVIETVGIKEGDIVADVGCGAGYWTYYLSAAVGETGPTSLARDLSTRDDPR